MRYAHGILIGAVIPGVIFLVAAAIRILGIGADAVVLYALWEVYKIWFVASIAIAILPVLLIFLARRDMFREFLIFEAGGFGLFSPIWIFITTDISGTPWYSILIDGITDGLIGLGPGGGVVGVDISNIFLVPFLAISFIIGIVFLRPSFIAKYAYAEISSKHTDLKTDTETKEESSIDTEMPDVKAPEITVDSVAALREVLIEHGTTDAIINLILNSGIGSITDLSATSANQLSNLTGLDKRQAEQLLKAVQKKIWFGDI